MCAATVMSRTFFPPLNVPPEIGHRRSVLSLFVLKVRSCHRLNSDRDGLDMTMHLYVVTHIESCGLLLFLVSLEIYCGSFQPQSPELVGRLIDTLARLFLDHVFCGFFLS